jgi:LacI family transcriptional regulator
LAKRLGVSHTTVSLALREHASIPQKTQSRVKALARKLGYRPDPMLSALVAYRHGMRLRTFQGVLGWLTNYPTEGGWAVGQQVGYHAGVRQRAKELGYELEDFWLNEPGVSRSRLRQIMTARNIRGLVVAPQPQPRTRIEFDWSGLAAVSLGYSLAEPKLHLVMNHQFRNMVALVQELLSRKRERIGLVMPAARDDRVDHNYLAGYLMGMHSAPGPGALPPHFPEQLVFEDFVKWYVARRPEVIVTEAGSAALIESWLCAARLPGLPRAGLVLTNTPYHETRFSGIDEHPELVGATAADVVVGMIHRNEFGVPDNARHILIQGSWHEGRTIGRNRRVQPVSRAHRKA